MTLSNASRLVSLYMYIYTYILYMYIHMYTYVYIKKHVEYAGNDPQQRTLWSLHIYIYQGVTIVNGSSE